MDKKTMRLRRAKRTRCKIKSLSMPRLCIYRTPRHIYAQIIMPDGKVVTAISTLGAAAKKECAFGGNVEAAKVVGKLIAQQSLSLNITRVAFDRSGFLYHGRVKALADAAREEGLLF